VQHDDPTEQALVTRLRALSTELAAAPDPAYRAATRQRLVAMAAVQAPGTAGRRPPARVGALPRVLAGSASSRRRTRLTAGLAGAALTVTALGGLLAAAQGARPGDLLYDLKRGGEQTQLALAGDSSRGRTLLDFASTRLDEVGELVGVDPNADAVVGTTPSGGEVGLAAGPDADLVLTTLQTMDAQTTGGTAALTEQAVQQADAGVLRQLTDWAAGQQSGLAELAPVMPTGALPGLDAARSLVDQVVARGAALGTALACPGGPSTAGADELGPLPAACPAAAPPTAAAAPATPAAPSPAPSDPGPSGSVPAASTPAPGAAAPGAPGATSAAVPSTGALPTGALPTPTVPARPGLELPSLPGLPPAPTSTAPVVSVPPLVPGVQVCAPPLITVGC